MAAKQEESVRIDVTANGYVVQPAGNIRDGGFGSLIGGWHVFESFDALVAHLRERIVVYPEGR